MTYVNDRMLILGGDSLLPKESSILDKKWSELPDFLNRDEFEIDYSSSYPKVKDGTLTNDPISNEALIISKGVINTDDVLFTNIYTTTNYAAAIRIPSGSANIKNTDFIPDKVSSTLNEK